MACTSGQMLTQDVSFPWLCQYNSVSWYSNWTATSGGLEDTAVHTKVNAALAKLVNFHSNVNKIDTNEFVWPANEVVIQ